MCRFALITSEQEISSPEFLGEFSGMCERSFTPDGDRQEDGWGVAWREGDAWKSFKSLSPIWQDTGSFSQIPNSNFLAVHARSASFSAQKNQINYNQPYIAGDYAFVFNGFLQGVKMPAGLPGKIGAQKIFELLKIKLKTKSPGVALNEVRDLLIANTHEIVGLNVGLCDGKGVFSISHFTKHPEYYSLSINRMPGFHIIASEQFGRWFE